MSPLAVFRLLLHVHDFLTGPKAKIGIARSEIDSIFKKRLESCLTEISQSQSLHRWCNLSKIFVCLGLIFALITFDSHWQMNELLFFELYKKIAVSDLGSRIEIQHFLMNIFSEQLLVRISDNFKKYIIACLKINTHQSITLYHLIMWYNIFSMQNENHHQLEMCSPSNSAANLTEMLNSERRFYLTNMLKMQQEIIDTVVVVARATILQAFLSEKIDHISDAIQLEMEFLGDLPAVHRSIPLEHHIFQQFFLSQAENIADESQAQLMLLKMLRILHHLKSPSAVENLLQTFVKEFEQYLNNNSVVIGLKLIDSIVEQFGGSSNAIVNNDSKISVLSIAVLWLALLIVPRIQSAINCDFFLDMCTKSETNLFTIPKNDAGYILAITLCNHQSTVFNPLLENMFRMFPISAKNICIEKWMKTYGELKCLKMITEAEIDIASLRSFCDYCTSMKTKDLTHNLFIVCITFGNDRKIMYGSLCNIQTVNHFRMRICAKFEKNNSFINHCFDDRWMLRINNKNVIEEEKENKEEDNDANSFFNTLLNIENNNRKKCYIMIDACLTFERKKYNITDIFNDNSIDSNIDHEKSIETDKHLKQCKNNIQKWKQMMNESKEILKQWKKETNSMKNLLQIQSMENEKLLQKIRFLNSENNSESNQSYIKCLQILEQQNEQKNDESVSESKIVSSHDWISECSMQIDIQCMQMLEQQKHCLKIDFENKYQILNQFISDLKEIKIRNESKVHDLHEKWKAMSVKNEQCKQETLELKLQLDTLLKNYKIAVDVQSEIGIKFDQTDEWLATLKSEENMNDEELYVPCSLLVSDFLSFKNSTQDMILRLQNILDCKWPVIEKHWRKWSKNDILNWIRYKMRWMSESAFPNSIPMEYWKNTISSNLKNKNEIQSIEQLTDTNILQNIGFSEIEHRNMISEFIQKLIL